MDTPPDGTPILVTFHGNITYGDPDREGVSTLSCPTCQADTGITVHGFIGQPAQLQCPEFHEFEPPDQLDAVQMLKDTAVACAVRGQPLKD